MIVINTGESIANAVLNNNVKITDVAKTIKMSVAGVRHKMHLYLQGKNPKKYQDLLHTNIYADGSVNEKCLPLLCELRANKECFFDKKTFNFNMHEETCGL